MPARILDGKRLAKSVRAEVAAKVADFSKHHGRPPGLNVVLIGENPASQVYVRTKETQCNEAGMRGTVHRLPHDVTQSELLHRIDDLNQDPTVDGILVQLPLPRQIDDQAVIERVSPLKDVDGFHPENVGLLAIGRPRFVPCTPLGVQRLLISAEIPTRGMRAVVLGRSNIVGKPMALLLLGRGPGADATLVFKFLNPDDR